MFAAEVILDSFFAFRSGLENLPKFWNLYHIFLHLYSPLFHSSEMINFFAVRTLVRNFTAFPIATRDLLTIVGSSTTDYPLNPLEYFSLTFLLRNGGAELTGGTSVADSEMFRLNKEVFTLTGNEISTHHVSLANLSDRRETLKKLRRVLWKIVGKEDGKQR